MAEWFAVRQSEAGWVMGGWELRRAVESGGMRECEGQTHPLISLRGNGPMSGQSHERGRGPEVSCANFRLQKLHRL